MTLEAPVLPRSARRTLYRKVLCATDLSPTGDSSVGLAYRLVRSGGEILLLHVDDPNWVDDPIWAPGTPGAFLPHAVPPHAASPDASRQAAERHALEHLQRLPARAGRPDVASEERVVHHPNAATAILEQAESAGADAIVLGTHGRTGLRRLLLGSVATDVLRRARLPVVLYHDPLVPAR